MSLEPSEFKYISTDSNGVAYIVGTTTKVREIVLEVKAYGWSADQIFRQHPYLSMSQIHAALAYYFDHRQGVDGEIEEDLSFIEKVDVVGLDPEARRKLDEARQS